MSSLMHAVRCVTKASQVKLLRFSCPHYASLHFVIPISGISHSLKSRSSKLQFSNFWKFLLDTLGIWTFHYMGIPQLDNKSCVLYIANRSLAILEG